MDKERIKNGLRAYLVYAIIFLKKTAFGKKEAHGVKTKLFGILVVLSAAAMMLTGCRDSIFLEKDAKDEYHRYGKEELSDGKVYVKDGTGFYLLYQGERSFSSAATTQNETRVAWNRETADEKIPTLYKGESLAYCTKNSVPESTVLERFVDGGYTIGIRGIKRTDVNEETGYNLPFTTDGNIYKESQAETAFADYDDSNKIILSEVDEKPVTNYELSRCGTILGLKKGKTYKMDAYVGSHQEKIDLIADVHVFFSDSFSKIEKDSITLTKNGYASIKLPEDTPSGYYYLGSSGLFRYINCEKAKAPDKEKIDYDEGLTRPITGTEERADVDEESDGKDNKITKEIAVEEENTSITVQIKALDEKISVYDVTVVKPDKTEEKLTATDGVYIFHAEEAETGTYLFTITGKDLSDDKIEVKTDLKKSESKETEQEDSEVPVQQPVTEQPAPSAPVTQNSSTESETGTETEIYYEEVPQEVNPLYSTEQSGTQPAP